MFAAKMAPATLHRAPESHTADVNCLFYQQERLYSAADDGRIKIWTADLSPLADLEAHTSSIYCLTASESRLFSCSDDGSIKSWDLATLKSSTLFRDVGCEFWSIKFADGRLYAGDQEGNVRIYCNGAYYAVLNVAAGVKSMALYRNLLFTSRNSDVVVTFLRLEEEKFQFGIKNTLVGGGPLEIVDNLLFHVTRSGRGIVFSSINDDDHQKITEECIIEDAHEMIINSLATGGTKQSRFLISGGWDKQVKKWRIENMKLIEQNHFPVDFVINALICSTQNLVYVAGNGGAIVCINLE